MSNRRVLRKSSWSPINGDLPLRYPQLLALHLLRRLENLCSRGNLPNYRPYRSSRPVVLRLPKDPTPSRQINLDFLESLNFSRLRAWLGPVHVADIGCGRGDYAARFLAMGAESYHGVDVLARDEWECCGHPSVTFERVECGRHPLELPHRCNLIFSQSALEHVRWDVSLMEDVARHCQAAGHPVLQLHLVPGPASIALYGAHGWRVYGAGQVARLIAPFSDDAEACVWGMGSAAARQLHYRRFADNRLRRILVEPFRRYAPDRGVVGEVPAEQTRPRSAAEADFFALLLATGMSLPDDLIESKATA